MNSMVFFNRSNSSVNDEVSNNKANLFYLVAEGDQIKFKVKNDYLLDDLLVVHSNTGTLSNFKFQFLNLLSPVKSKQLLSNTGCLVVIYKCFFIFFYIKMVILKEFLFFK